MFQPRRDQIRKAWKPASLQAAKIPKLILFYFHIRIDNVENDNPHIAKGVIPPLDVISASAYPPYRLSYAGNSGCCETKKRAAGGKILVAILVWKYSYSMSRKCTWQWHQIGVKVSQVTTPLYSTLSTVYSYQQQRKHQRSVTLTFRKEKSPIAGRYHKKGTIMWKLFHAMHFGVISEQLLAYKQTFFDTNHASLCVVK